VCIGAIPLGLSPERGANSAARNECFANSPSAPIQTSIDALLRRGRMLSAGFPIEFSAAKRLLSSETFWMSSE
jgi:hypothetical protein